jgi:hypothetical protein
MTTIYTENRPTGKAVYNGGNFPIEYTTTLRYEVKVYSAYSQNYVIYTEIKNDHTRGKVVSCKIKDIIIPEVIEAVKVILN